MPLGLERAKHPGAPQIVHQGAIDMQQVQATPQFCDDMLIPYFIKQCSRHDQTFLFVSQCLGCPTGSI